MVLKINEEIKDVLENKNIETFRPKTIETFRSMISQSIQTFNPTKEL